MKKITIINFLFLTFVSLCDAQSPLKLYITFSKDAYLTGEYEQFEIGVVNISNNLYSKGWKKLILKLIDENGNNVQYKGISDPVFLEWKGQEIKPGEKAYNILLMNDSFGKRWPSLATVDLYLNPGKYTLRGTLYLTDGDTNKGEASFKVIEPTGEELSIYNSFVNIITNYHPNFPIHNSHQTATNLQSLIDKHKNTVYAPLILEILDAMYDFDLEEYNKAYLTRKMLVEEYSWSVRGWPMVEGILYRMSSDSERVKYLEKILVNTKGTMMEKSYAKKIEALQKKQVK